MKVQRVLKILGLYLLLVFTACGPVPNLNVPPQPTENTQTSANNSDGAIKIAPMEAPPQFDERPPLPGQTGRDRTADDLPIISSPRGLNVKNLFAERIRDTDKRTTRVEMAVQEIRNDFDSILPSLLRLVAIEKDIDSLVLQLESLVLTNPDFAAPDENTPSIDTKPSIAPLQASIAPQQSLPDSTTDTASLAPADQDTQRSITPQTPTIPPQQPFSNNKAPISFPSEEARPQPLITAQTTPPKNRADSGTKPMVTKVRTGIHKEKARLVIDMSAPSAYTHEIDEKEGILIVSMPETNWTGALQNAAIKNPLIKSWSVEKRQVGGGTMVVVDLVRGTKILSTFTLGANNSSGARIVFDLK